MSFIINPVSRRFGYSKFWLNVWSSTSYENYMFLNSLDRIILTYISVWAEYFKSFKHTRLYFWLLHLRIFRLFDNLKIIILLRTNQKYNNLQYLSQIKKISNESQKENKDEHLILWIDRLLLFYSKYKNNLKYIFILKNYIICLKVLYIYYFWICKKIFLNWKGQLINYIFQYFFLHKVLTSWIGFLKYIVKNFFYKKVDFYIVCTTVGLLSAWYLVNYLRTKLKQKFPVTLLVNLLLKQLFQINRIYKIFYGIKICVSGRFTRKERKLFWWISKGSIGYNNFYVNFDYSAGTVILLNSLCGLKVWLNLTQKFKSNFEIVI